jgi:hypothetical protein
VAAELCAGCKNREIEPPNLVGSIWGGIGTKNSKKFLFFTEIEK